MIHHVSLGSNDLERARAFYDPVMKELGLNKLACTDRILAYGLTSVLFSLEKPEDGAPASVGNGTHIAFHAGHRRNVHACHEAGLANGGGDAGAPGLRSRYDPNYYACFLRDPDGNKIEIVTFAGD